jgi:DNA-binding beta-propeller fold protein YncE
MLIVPRMPKYILFITILFNALAQQRTVSDPGVITTRQAITPAGLQSVFDGRVYGVAFGKTSSEVWVLHRGEISLVDWRANKTLAHITFEGSAGLGGIRYDASTDRAMVNIANHGEAELWSVRRNGSHTSWKLGASANSGALAISERVAVVPLIHGNMLAIADLARGNVRTVKTEIAPFGAALSHDSSIAYVTNWGGRAPKPGDLTAPTGHAAGADRVVTDERGIASTGTVSRIDLIMGKVEQTIPVGLHPTAIVWDEPLARAYVANGNQDSISVIDTNRNKVVQTFVLQPFSRIVAGVAPTALALADDGSALYVACGGINAIAVLNPADGKQRGLIPTAWYPNSLSISEGHLAIGTLLGVGSGWRDDPKHRYVHSNRGSIHVLPIPTKSELASFTNAVIVNNLMVLPPSDEKPRAGAKPVPVPERAGEASTIEHIVYIVKENRTYDQVLGDLGRGNGDPSFAIYGAEVTPNQHKLAHDFVTLDNFYAAGGNSADGHQWLTQANETAYCLWPGYEGRSYPYDGSDPIAPSAGGFVWESAQKMKKTVRIFGEYAGETSTARDARAELLKQWKSGTDFTSKWNIVAPIAPMNKILAKNFPAYTTNIPDVVRAQIFISELKKRETMPNLTLIQLPSNHTQGTASGASTAKAMVADNDYALGQIVEALSHSKFWKTMQIFIVEDDAQNGVDHVDGHRTVALAVGPFIKRGAVDSTFYSNPGMLKTIELILGLPTMSLFDLIAADMRASFTDTPDFTPFSAVEPKHDLFEVNPPLKALHGAARRDAEASLKMEFDLPDRAPAEKLNRILWADAKGYRVKYPALMRSIFAPLAMDVDDDDR